MRISRQIELAHKNLFRYIDIIEKQLNNNVIERFCDSSVNQSRESKTNFIEDFAFHEFWECVFPNQVCI